VPKERYRAVLRSLSVCVASDEKKRKKERKERGRLFMDNKLICNTNPLNLPGGERGGKERGEGRELGTRWIETFRLFFNVPRGKKKGRRKRKKLI